MLTVLSVAAALLSALALAQAPPPRLDTSANVSYFIESGGRIPGYLDSDRELAALALAAWARESGGVLKFETASSPATAIIRVRWISAGAGVYGETERVSVDGKPGAVVNVMPDVSQLGDPIAGLAKTDRLLRDTIVYLTCVHEIGHALGLVHTREFGDIMYYFGYGGDIVRYFERYRMMLRSREDIRRNSGVSPSDRRALLGLYPN